MDMYEISRKIGAFCLITLPLRGIIMKEYECDKISPKKHYCKAVDHPDATIRCVSVIDSKIWFCLIWIDGSSLLVKYCPFCGESVEKLNQERENCAR